MGYFTLDKSSLCGEITFAERGMELVETHRLPKMKIKKVLWHLSKMYTLHGGIKQGEKRR